MRKYLLTFLSCIIFFNLNAQRKYYPYLNPKLPIQQRINDLLARMNLAEKVSQLRHMHPYSYLSNEKVDYNKLGRFTHYNSFGTMDGFALSSDDYLKVIYNVQKFMRDSTRLGIPIIPVLESLHGVVQDGCTIFPQSIALAATFRPDLVNKMGLVIGKEMNALGAKQAFAPDLDLAREIRWGRVEETYGEDPFLVGTMGVAYCKGLQSQNIITTPKHFVAHGTPSGGINLAPVSGGMHDLYSLYLQPFEKTISETNPLSIMNCYSSYDGEPIAGSNFFLTDLLRKQLKFKGYVYSDWGSISMLYNFHHTASNQADAALQALTAGLDVEASSNTYSELEGLIKKQKLNIKYIDSAVSHVLYAKFMSGLFDAILPDTSTSYKKLIRTPQSIELAKKIADESTVLLKNENKLLPLNIDKIHSIAVIGPNANETQFGDYTWSNSAGDGINPLDGLTKKLKGKIKINYALGCDITGMDTSGFDKAVSAAQQSDVSVVFVGSRSAALAKDNLPATSGEGYDLTDLHLTGMQSELIKAIYRTKKPIVLVLVTGRPFVLSWESENIPAILVQWYGGQKEGSSIADILFGKVNPSGKLPISFPKSNGNIPDYYNYLPSERGYYRSPGNVLKPGRDYVFEKPGALWPFGFGLSYTEFALSHFNILEHFLLDKDTIHTKVTVKNIGNKDGSEVVQTYIRDLVSTIETPIRSLKGFQKVYLKTGEEKEVAIDIPVNTLALYNKELKRVVEPGQFKIEIGVSSGNILSTDTISIVQNMSNKFGSINSPSTKVPHYEKIKLSTNIIGIKGIVRDVQASVIANVIVSTKFGGTSTQTDRAGKYKISSAINDVLVFSKSGFPPIEIPVNNQNVVNAILE